MSASSSSDLTISLVVAMGIGRVIGNGGDLPWHLPADLAYFKRTTMGKPILMGRKTYESIGRPLPGRLNLVMTRDASFEAPGCTVVQNVAAAEEQVKKAAAQFHSNSGSAPELMVIGGEQIYRLFLPKAHRLYITRVDAVVDGDAFFPTYDADLFEEKSRLVRPRDEKNAYSMTFLVLDRLSSAQS